MGRVKSALRSYALISDDPAQVLELTDRKVQHFEIGTMVTALCATSKPPYSEFTLCSAGHPAPVLGLPGQGSELVEIPVGPPLGAAPGSQSRFDCFRARFTAQDATNSVPTFNYLVLSNDHTEVLSAGARTPRAMNGTRTVVS